jgi:hypothetical protein
MRFQLRAERGAVAQDDWGAPVRTAISHELQASVRLPVGDDISYSRCDDVPVVHLRENFCHDHLLIVAHWRSTAGPAWLSAPLHPSLFGTRKANATPTSHSLLTSAVAEMPRWATTFRSHPGRWNGLLSDRCW